MSHVGQIPMDCTRTLDRITFHRVTGYDGSAADQVEAGIAAIVAKAVEEDRARWARGEANRDGIESCPSCDGSGSVGGRTHPGAAKLCLRCMGAGLVIAGRVAHADGPPAPPSFRARLGAALAARLGAAAVDEAADGLAAGVQNGDPDAIRLAFEVLGDGGGEGGPT